MNISFQTQVASRYNFAQALDLQSDASSTGVQDAADEAIHDLSREESKPGRDMGGLAKDGPGDAMRNGKDSSFGAFELGAGRGLDGIDLTEFGALEDLAKGLGSDLLGQAEGMASGELGAGSITPGAQDRFGSNMQQLGSTSGGGGWEFRLAWGGAVVGCAVGAGIGKSVQGCVVAGAAGYHAGEFVGKIMDAGPGTTGSIEGAQGSGGSEQSKGSDNGASGKGGTGGNSGASEAGSEQKSETQACDEKSQPCTGTTQEPPSAGGMGDNQDDSGMGDPVYATITLQRRAKAGDGKSAGVLAAGKGDGDSLIPSWDVQPGTQDTNQSEGQVLGRVARHGDNFDGTTYYQFAGAPPPKEFVETVQRRADDPVINPLQA